MYMIDTRQTTKQEVELIEDRQKIMEAFNVLKGVNKFRYYTNNVPNKIEPFTNNVGHVTILDEPSNGKGIDIFESKFFSFKQVSLTQYYAFAYGEVIYIRELSNEYNYRSIVYVMLKGTILYKKVYYEVMDLWEFALHYQNAIKEHKELEFQENLKKDCFFYR